MEDKTEEGVNFLFLLLGVLLFLVILSAVGYFWFFVSAEPVRAPAPVEHLAPAPAKPAP